MLTSALSQLYSLLLHQLIGSCMREVKWPNCKRDFFLHQLFSFFPIYVVDYVVIMLSFLHSHFEVSWSAPVLCCEESLVHENAGSLYIFFLFLVVGKWNKLFLTKWFYSRQNHLCFCYHVLYVIPKLWCNKLYNANHSIINTFHLARWTVNRGIYPFFMKAVVYLQMYDVEADVVV